ncbi:transposase (plasmid) [Bacillus sp. FDAARGOS_1420]|nr:transposase [Bacillus sp. FDAARGOS_1420]
MSRWECPSCGTHHDRDSNASINLKNENGHIRCEIFYV